MHYMEDGNPQNDEYSDKRKERYGECPTCNRYNTSYSWCQSCNPKLLTEGWTSGNETLDELIKVHNLKQLSMVIIIIFNGFLIMI